MTPEQLDQYRYVEAMRLTGPPKPQPAGVYHGNLLANYRKLVIEDWQPVSLASRIADEVEALLKQDVSRAEAFRLALKRGYEMAQDDNNIISGS